MSRTDQESFVKMRRNWGGEGTFSPSVQLPILIGWILGFELGGVVVDILACIASAGYDSKVLIRAMSER